MEINEFHSLIDYHKNILQILKNDIVPHLIEIIEPHSPIDFIILYGSHSRNDYSTMSDVDLLICSQFFRNIRKMDRTDPFEELLGKIPLEIICYTPEESLKAYEDMKLTILDSLEEGILLYSSGSFYNSLKNKFLNQKANDQLLKLKFNGRSYWKSI